MAFFYGDIQFTVLTQLSYTWDPMTFLSTINKMKSDICLGMEKFLNTVFIFSELLSGRFWGRIEGWEGERKKLEINQEI